MFEDGGSIVQGSGKMWTISASMESRKDSSRRMTAPFHPANAVRMLDEFRGTVGVGTVYAGGHCDIDGAWYT